MDLQEVVAQVNVEAAEALSASNAGHIDQAEGRLHAIENLVVEYLRMPATPAGDVTESATSEKPEETSQETPAPAAGAVLPATQFAHPADDQKKALDQAGP